MSKTKNIPTSPRVALIIETSKKYGRDILCGINRYAKLHGPWSIYVSERGQDDPDPPWLPQWQGDGIITRSLNMRWCEQAQERGIPVVSLRHLEENPAFPTLFPDQAKITTRVVRHLAARGIQNFAYIGIPGNKGWERLRQQTFIEILNERKNVTVLIRPTLIDPDVEWENQEQVLADWVAGLPKPIGIMVNHDTQGLQLLDACRRAGAQVPDEVAVVSVDNDSTLCELAAPPLSSLDQKVEILGYQAAEFLDRMMQGTIVKPGNYFTEPGEIASRRSSDVIAVEDPNLIKAIRFIRENACRDVTVNHVAIAAGLSRRSLEKKFADIVGHSPLKELHDVRLRRVKKLLEETDYNLPQIAEIAGFQYQEYLVRFFRKHTKVTPGAYRRNQRLAKQ